MIKAIAVGIDKYEQGELYRLLVCNYNPGKSGRLDWSFKCITADKKEIINLFNKQGGNDFYMNISVEDNYNIKGKTASLNRFKSEDGEHHPFVIISQIQNKEGNILGYKIGTYDGRVKNISLKEMLAYGNRINKQGKIPVQNAIFIPEENGKRAYFKSYTNMEFIVDTYESGKNQYVESRRIQTTKNEKTLVKASEIFSTEQLKELGLGKKNGVDIRIYANPKLTPEQMKVLRNGLQSGINVKPFAFPEYSKDCMLSYIYDLKNGLDIRKYLSSKYNLSQMFQLSLATELGLDISKMSNPKLTADEMAEIRERMEANIWKDELVKKDGSWK